MWLASPRGSMVSGGGLVSLTSFRVTVLWRVGEKHALTLTTATVRGGALYTLLLSPTPAHTHATLDHRQLQLSLHTWKWKVGKQ